MRAISGHGTTGPGIAPGPVVGRPGGGGRLEGGRTTGSQDRTAGGCLVRATGGLGQPPRLLLDLAPNPVDSEHGVALGPLVALVHDAQ